MCFNNKSQERFAIPFMFMIKCTRVDIPHNEHFHILLSLVGLILIKVHTINMPKHFSHSFSSFSAYVYVLNIRMILFRRYKYYGVIKMR